MQLHQVATEFHNEDYNYPGQTQGNATCLEG